MPQDFLFELGTEELPPTSLLTLSNELTQHLQASLADAKLAYQSCQAFATPRRLAVLITALDEQAPEEALEIFGPPAKIAFDAEGKPTKAAEAFANKNGISVGDLETDDATGKLVFRTLAKGAVAADVLPAFIVKALDALPIAKRMRWGATRAEFVRPVKWVVLLLGDKTIDAEIYGVTSGNTTRGHRFHSQGELTLAKPADYETSLKQAYVIADFHARQRLVRKQVEDAAKSLGGTAVISDDLLDEVTALVEWPVALSGQFEKEFLRVPQEALISSMKEHQKYFHVVDAKGALLPSFITLSNLQSQDPAQVIDGNEKVIRPRLADAAFFFDQDKQTRLDERREKLKSVVFQARLGSIFDKTERIEKLAGFVAEKLSLDPQACTQVARAAQLCKSDLVSNMVYEFPDMQGIAGYHYALNDGEDDIVATALNEHYQPRFAGDTLPESDVAALIALADRLDTIVGIFGIGQIPTGSKDPFALRRASLGALRILVEKEYDLDLKPLLEKAAALHANLPQANRVVDDVLNYMLERFRAWYEEANIPAEVFLAVSAKKLSCPLDINKRVYAVAEFSKLSEAAALASANKRVSNILAKLENDVTGELNKDLLQEDAERKLAEALASLSARVQPLFAANNYTEALSTLAALRESVDTFFDKVMVMCDDEALKNNRLVLLQQLRALFLEVADISLLAVKN